MVSDSGVFGIYIAGTGAGNVVSGNYVGTDATGTKAVGAQTSGIAFDSDSTPHLVIGTNGTGPSSAAERNVISGGNQYGVEVFGFNQGLESSDIVAGNFIGTDASGANPLGNANAGIILLGSRRRRHDRVPTLFLQTASMVSGRPINSSPGFYRNQITIGGNSIGTDFTGTLNLANGSDGIRLGNDTRDVSIGGTAPGQANIIADNHTVMA